MRNGDTNSLGRWRRRLVERHDDGAIVNGNTAYGLTSSQLISGPAASTADNSFEPQSSDTALDTSPSFLPVVSFSFACLVAGTRISTQDGDVPVETLQVGQRVVVVRPDGTRAEQSVCWIGHRSIDLTRHADPRHAMPIRIRTDAFADGQPVRDLLVSPDHAIYLDGLLIPARLLQNDATILREDRLRIVRYFHVELEQHNIILAEGLPTESYLDIGNRNVFENSDEPLVLHPDLAADDGRARRESLSCAPFVSDAKRVESAWRRLAMRAHQLGFEITDPITTTDPALHLMVNGRACWPVATTNDRHIFVLPRSAISIRVMSRTSAPCDVTPWIEDQRRRGVAVGRVVFAGPFGRVDMALDHPSLLHGWWPAEHDGPKFSRWTAGNAELPLPPDVFIVEIHLAGANTYLLGAERDGAASIGERLSARP